MKKIFKKIKCFLNFHEYEIKNIFTLLELKIFLYTKYKKLNYLEKLALKRRLEKDGKNQKEYKVLQCKYCKHKINEIAEISNIIIKEIKNG